MSYNPFIPAINTRIDQTYNLVTTNFTALDNIFDKDHYKWDYVTVADQGLHRQVTLLQGGNPAAGALRGEVYTKVNPAPGPGTITRTDLYYRYNLGGLGNSQIVPLVPFKAFASFDPQAAAIGADIPAASIFQSMNIQKIHRDAATVWTVTYANNLNDQAAATAMEYVVLVSSISTGPGSFPQYSATQNSGFSLSGGNLLPGYRISFGVITL